MNFYAYLQTLADRHVMSLLSELDNRELIESTLIVRLADHGEMGMAHGMREKMYNAYEETIHVPHAVYFNTEGSKFEYKMYDVKSDPHENTNLADIEAHERQLAILHAKLHEKMKSAGTAPAGIPLVTPQLEAIAKKSDDKSLIPDIHWPTTDEAVEQSRKQRQRDRPDFEGLAGKMKNKGFWIAHARS